MKDWLTGHKVSRLQRFISYSIDKWINASNRVSNWFWFKVMMWADQRLRDRIARECVTV